MGKLKMQVKVDDLIEYEKEYNLISFRRLFDKLFTDAILCNDITKLFYADINGKYSEPLAEIGTDYDEENDEYIDIYQYFIVDFNSYTYSKMQEFSEQLGQEFIMYYIDILDIYVVGITHFGTSWDYVLTDIEPTEDTEKANI